MVSPAASPVVSAVISPVASTVVSPLAWPPTVNGSSELDELTTEFSVLVQWILTWLNVFSIKLQSSQILSLVVVGCCISYWFDGHTVISLQILLVNPGSPTKSNQ